MTETHATGFAAFQLGMRTDAPHPARREAPNGDGKHAFASALAEAAPDSDPRFAGSPDVQALIGAALLPQPTQVSAPAHAGFHPPDASTSTPTHVGFAGSSKRADTGPAAALGALVVGARTVHDLASSPSPAAPATGTSAATSFTPSAFVLGAQADLQQELASAHVETASVSTGALAGQRPQEIVESIVERLAGDGARQAVAAELGDATFDIPIVAHPPHAATPPRVGAPPSRHPHNPSSLADVDVVDLPSALARAIATHLRGMGAVGPSEGSARRADNIEVQSAEVLQALEQRRPTMTEPSGLQAALTPTKHEAAEPVRAMERGASIREGREHETNLLREPAGAPLPSSMNFESSAAQLKAAASTVATHGVEQVLDSLDARVHVTDGEARVAVDLGEGEVAMKLRVHGHSVVIALQGAGAASLEARLPELRAALATEGLTLENLELGRQGTDGGAFGQHSSPDDDGAAPEQPETAPTIANSPLSIGRAGSTLRRAGMHVRA